MFGQFGTKVVNHFDFVEFKCANFPKLEYSRMVCFFVKYRALKLRNLCSLHGCLDIVTTSDWASTLTKISYCLVFTTLR